MIFSPLFKRHLFKRLALFSFLLLVVAAALFPSEGSRGFLNPKVIPFLLFICSFVFYFLTERKMGEREALPLGALFLLFSSLCTWIFIALYRGTIDPSSILDETKLLLVTFIPFLGAVILNQREVLRLSSLLKVLIFTNALYSLIKMGLLVALFLKIITFTTLVEATGIRVMSLDIAKSFSRILTSCDIFTPFLLFFVVGRKHFDLELRKIFVWLYVPLSVLSIVVAFSRVFIFIGSVSIAFALLLNVQKRAIFSFYLLIFCSIGAVLAIGPEKVAAIIELRLFSRENEASDHVRKDQIEALSEEVFLHPFVGLGMGGYSSQVIRDHEIKHLYEVQWLAVLAQFGFLGLIPLLGPIFALSFSFFLSRFSKEKFFLFLLFLGWVASGATNPFVLSLASGVMYTLFAVALNQIETCHKNLPRKIV